MFFAETVTGFASEKGFIKESDNTTLSVKEMINQMVLMIKAGLKQPETFTLPLHRFVKTKHGL
jgi:hypothetical protein